MSIQANFAEWCRLRGLNPRPTVYLEDGRGEMSDGDARIVRMVHRRKRAGHRIEQTYVVEQFVNDTLSWPLGQHPLGQKQLLGALIRDTMKMEGTGQ